MISHLNELGKDISLRLHSRSNVARIIRLMINIKYEDGDSPSIMMLSKLNYFEGATDRTYVTQSSLTGSQISR